MSIYRELIVSAVGLLLLTNVAAFYPYINSTAPNAPDFIFGLAAALIVLLPLFLLPIVKKFVYLGPKYIHMILLAYWGLSFGFFLYGYSYETTEPALAELIFGWLLFVCICGIPIIVAVSTIWEKYGSP